MLLDNIHHLKRNEISVNEFEDFRRFFSLRDEISEVVLNEVLDDSYLFKAYGLDIYGQSKKWKTTASTGRNGYDFFNDMSWIAAHNKDFNLKESDSIELQILSGNLLSKPMFDIEDVASSVNVNFNKYFTNNN